MKSKRIKKKTVFTSVDGKVIKASCTPIDKNINCTLNVSYKYEGTEKTKFFTTISNLSYAVDQTVPVYIYDNNIDNSSLSAPISTSTGYVLIVIAIIIIFAAWVWYYITKKYKFAAAVQGFSSGGSIISRAW